MKHYQISIRSKNKKSLDKFLEKLYENLQNSTVTDKKFTKEKKRKILTILKSPHVNKKAQEQFQSNIYFKNINLYLLQHLKLVTFIKKIKSNLFADVQLKIKVSINKQLEKKVYKFVLNPANFKVNFLKQTEEKYLDEKIQAPNNKVFLNKNTKAKRLKQTVYLKHVKKLLQIMDIYGELTTKEKVL